MCCDTLLTYSVSAGTSIQNLALGIAQGTISGRSPPHPPEGTSLKP